MREADAHQSPQGTPRIANIKKQRPGPALKTEGKPEGEFPLYGMLPSRSSLCKNRCEWGRQTFQLHSQQEEPLQAGFWQWHRTLRRGQKESGSNTFLMLRIGHTIVARVKMNILLI